MTERILVAAAASLTEAFTEIGRAFARANPQTRVDFHFAASGALMQQIRAGAPIDVFASASPQEMDALAKTKYLTAGTRADFAGNEIVLIVPAEKTALPLRGWADLKAARVRRIALSNPDSVPSGRYARETLEKRGLWPLVRGKAILGENVRQTLFYVANGDVDAGIVFATDVRAQAKRVRIVARATAGRDHTPIRYGIAAIARSPRPREAAAFARFLRTKTAQAILRQQGFRPAPAASPARGGGGGGG